jgi:3-methyladenine DNA glycosylase AlkD
MLEALEARANAPFADSGRRFFKEPVQLMGVKAADMHAVAKELFAAAKPGLTLKDAIDVCQRLLPDPRSEVKITVLLLLGRLHKKLDAEVFEAAERWLAAGWCDSWAVIDTLCIYVLGPVLWGKPKLMPLTRVWIASPNLWLRRAGVVALVKPARKGLLLAEIHAALRPVLDDPEDLIQKAVGWLLRESGKTDETRLTSFLAAHGAECARTTLRYAIERLPSADRARILRETKKTN